jgi:dCMP deaminase
MDIVKWDRRWMEVAELFGTWSKDPSTRVGCVVVGTANQVLSQGFNGFPRGADDSLVRYQDRDLKYKWIEHAERNAIYNAARTGTSLVGSTLYVPWFPCTDCARAIVQSGIAVAVSYNPSGYGAGFMERWAKDIKISCDILTESDVGIRYIPERLSG